MFEYRYETVKGINGPQEILNIAKLLGKEKWELISVTSSLEFKWVDGITGTYQPDKISFIGFFKRTERSGTGLVHT